MTLLSLDLEDADAMVLALPMANAPIVPRLFKGRDVVLVPDSDDAGRKCVERLRSLFQPVARSLTIVVFEKADYEQRRIFDNPF